MLLRFHTIGTIVLIGNFLLGKQKSERLTKVFTRTTLQEDFILRLRLINLRPIPESNFRKAVPLDNGIDLNFRTFRKNLAGVRLYATSTFGENNVIGEDSRLTALKENEAVIKPVWF